MIKIFLRNYGKIISLIFILLVAIFTILDGLVFKPLNFDKSLREISYFSFNNENHLALSSFEGQYKRDTKTSCEFYNMESKDFIGSIVPNCEDPYVYQTDDGIKFLAELKLKTDRKNKSSIVNKGVITGLGNNIDNLEFFYVENEWSRPISEITDISSYTVIKDKVFVEYRGKHFDNKKCPLGKLMSFPENELNSHNYINIVKKAYKSDFICPNGALAIVPDQFVKISEDTYIFTYHILIPNQFFGIKVSTSRWLAGMSFISENQLTEFQDLKLHPSMEDIDNIVLLEGAEELLPIKVSENKINILFRDDKDFKIFDLGEFSLNKKTNNLDWLSSLKLDYASTRMYIKNFINRVLVKLEVMV